MSRPATGGGTHNILDETGALVDLRMRADRHCPGVLLLASLRTGRIEAGDIAPVAATNWVNRPLLGLQYAGFERLGPVRTGCAVPI